MCSCVLEWVGNPTHNQSQTYSGQEGRVCSCVLEWVGNPTHNQSLTYCVLVAKAGEGIVGWDDVGDS